MTNVTKEPISDDEFEELDSDEELQAAFSRGELQPGLNREATGKKVFKNDEEGLRDKLADFKKDLAWVERLDVTCGPAEVLGEAQEEEEKPQPKAKAKAKAKAKGDSEATDDVHDDFKRELRIYRQAQAAVLEALPKLQALNVSTKRPEDYFAEMAKSDDHMRKIREKLISKQLSMEKSEKAKKLRELRKFGKKVQQEVLIKRQKEKKDLAESVKKFKKGQSKDLGFLDGKPNSGDASKQGKAVAKGPNVKRKAKNTKFGYGGKRKGGKTNTKNSSREDDDHFSVRRNRADIAKHQKQFGGKQRKGGKQQRPGKGKRQKMKSRKK